MRFGEHPDKIRMVLELSRPASFRTFALDNPYRVVIDLPSFAWSVPAIEKPRASVIREIRHGPLNEGISRIVVDLSAPAVMRSAFIIPAAAGRKERLVIDFALTTPQDFNKNKALTLGDLKTGREKTAETSAPRNAPAPANVAQVEHPPVDTIPRPGVKPVIPASARGAIPQQEREKAKPPAFGKKPLIVLDPGHGGQDPGAIGANKAREKDVVLRAAEELKRQLEETGRFTVSMTRSSDKFIPLHKRVEFARKAGADLFISLHADSIDKPDVRGASIYTISDKASDAQTAKLAARENQVDLIAGVDLSHEDKDVANILIDLAMRDTMNQSKFLANTLVKTMKSRSIKLLPDPHRYAGFAVLKAPDIPSVLIEMGFMSNNREAEQLTTPEYRRKVTGSIVDGINLYFAKVQKNSRT
jgi:N-acetylmuramoyl-L-alanine amidase